MGFPSQLAALANEFINDKRLLSVNGYQKLPGGLIVQWGNAGGGTVYDITLPVAFPNGVFCVTAATQGSSSFGYTAEVSAFTTSSIRVTTYRVDTGAQAQRGICWVAIGY